MNDFYGLSKSNPYFTDKAPGFPSPYPDYPNPPQHSSYTYTVIVPPADQGELCVAFRLNPEAVRDWRVWQDWYTNVWPANPDPLLWNHPPFPAPEYPSWLDWLVNVWSLNPDPTLWKEPPYNVPGLAINFFDFSQEPSHEYVELANVTDEEVDVSGWTLEVGIPDPPGAYSRPLYE